jgi:protocatechuate 3,4-dioxygenase beta subunit
MVTALVLAAALVPSADLRGQADPGWLRSWNDAQGSRPAMVTPSGRIAPEDEPGIPLVIHGRVFGPDDAPAAGVVVHAYHRDSDGFDFGPGDDTLTTWRLQGWVETDAEGRFECQTIRPGPDHLGHEGAHIHITLESDDHGRQWAPTVFLSDDPLVTAAQRRRSSEAGDFAWVREVRATEGIQHLDVRIRLRETADF